MAVTNNMIILMERVRLMEEGVLEGNGQVAVVETPDGKKELEIPEEIHTYQHWKQLGYQVKKGEKAIAQFPIWKYTRKEKEDSNQIDEHCFMKKSSFFKLSQVEEIKK